MVGPWPHRPYTFYALAKTYGQMWLRNEVRRPGLFAGMRNGKTGPQV